MQEIDMIRAAADKGNIPNIYLWYGEDRFLLQAGLNILIDYYGQIDSSGSNVERLSARQTPVEVIVNKANSCSFFPKLIIVEDIPYFNENQGEEMEGLFRYLERPNPDTCLLLMAESVHKGRKLYKAIGQKGLIIEFTPPKRAAEWQAWIQDEVRKRGKTIKPTVAAFLLDWAGHQTGVLSQELDKLNIYLGERKEINPEDIHAVTTRTLEASIFSLLDAVAGRASGQAVQTLNDVLRQEHPLRILTLLTRQVRLLLGAHSAKAQGMPQDQMASALGIKPYESQKIWLQAGKLSESMLRQALSLCLSTERSIKTGKGEAPVLLELLVVRFCHFL